MIFPVKSSVRTHFALIAILLIPLLAMANAAEEFEDFSEVPLEDLLNTEVTVATKTGVGLRETPGVVTVITREEIRNSGARNVDDVLALVPGFHQAAEVQNTSGYGFRGLYGLEGKILVLIDGVPMNDSLYGNPIFGGQQFVDQIERVEVTRGPGSAVYGGFAELAVINIITRGASQKGATVSAKYGFTDETYTRRGVMVTAGGSVGEAGVSVSAGVGDGHLSGRDFTDYNDEVFDLDEYGAQNYWYINAAFDYRGFLFRYIGNNYEVKTSIPGYWDNTGTVFTPAYPDPVPTRFTSHVFHAAYRFQPVDRWTVIPSYTYSIIESWIMDERGVDAYWGYFNFPAARQTAHLTVMGDPVENLSLVFGGEFIEDDAWAKGGPAYNTFSDGSDHVDYQTWSGFAQGMVRTSSANFTLGARYDNHSAFGEAFVPRFAVTRRDGPFHVKAMASRAYRAPAIMNINDNPDIKPEYTTIYELETGYLFNDNLFMTVNLYDMRIEDVIVYYVEGGQNVWGYYNYDEVATRGLETELRYKDSWGYLNLSYAYYYSYANDVANWKARDNDGDNVDSVLLGMPTHKATLNGHFIITPGVSVNPTVIYMSERYNTYWSEDAGGYVYDSLDPTVLTNLYLRVAPASWKGLEAGVGVYNVFNEDYEMAPGYMNYDRAIPAQDREYMVKLAYTYR